MAEIEKCEASGFNLAEAERRGRSSSLCTLSPTGTRVRDTSHVRVGVSCAIAIYMQMAALSVARAIMQASVLVRDLFSPVNKTRGSTESSHT